MSCRTFSSSKKKPHPLSFLDLCALRPAQCLPHGWRPLDALSFPRQLLTLKALSGTRKPPPGPLSSPNTCSKSVGGSVMLFAESSFSGFVSYKTSLGATLASQPPARWLLEGKQRLRQGCSQHPGPVCTSERSIPSPSKQTSYSKRLFGQIGDKIPPPRLGKLPRGQWPGQQPPS